MIVAILIVRNIRLAFLRSDISSILGSKSLLPDSFRIHGNAIKRPRAVERHLPSVPQGEHRIDLGSMPGGDVGCEQRGLIWQALGRAGWDVSTVPRARGIERIRPLGLAEDTSR